MAKRKKPAKSGKSSKPSGRNTRLYKHTIAGLVGSIIFAPLFIVIIIIEMIDVVMFMDSPANIISVSLRHPLVTNILYYSFASLWALAAIYAIIVSSMYLMRYKEKGLAITTIAFAVASLLAEYFMLR